MRRRKGEDAVKRAARQKAWVAAHRDRVKVYSLMHALKRYGLTLLQYGQMVARQGGVCAICGRAEWHKIKGTVSRLKIDHDHATGKVRGLLCNECNRRLFHLEDPAWTKKALSYLETVKNDEAPKTLVGIKA